MVKVDLNPSLTLVLNVLLYNIFILNKILVKTKFLLILIFGGALVNPVVMFGNHSYIFLKSSLLFYYVIVDAKSSLLLFYVKVDAPRAALKGR